MEAMRRSVVKLEPGTLVCVKPVGEQEHQPKVKGDPLIGVVYRQDPSTHAVNVVTSEGIIGEGTKKKADSLMDNRYKVLGKHVQTPLPGVEEAVYKLLRKFA